LEQIILGIDPGTSVMGFSVISIIGKTVNVTILDVLRLAKIDSHPLKLKKIFETTLRLINEYHPDSLAIEAPFFGKNVQSMLKLGRAQGVAMAAALYRDIPVFEYSPRKIKQSITGNGAASKEQVAAMLSNLIQFKNDSTFLDATDALAVAYCHYLQRNTKNPTTEYNSWAGFISKNPERVTEKRK
jgi:crossover junction endodeoxyribonuclease RuvC